MFINADSAATSPDSDITCTVRRLPTREYQLSMTSMTPEFSRTLLSTSAAPTVYNRGMPESMKGNGRRNDTQHRENNERDERDYVIAYLARNEQYERAEKYAENNCLIHESAVVSPIGDCCRYGIVTVSYHSWMSLTGWAGRGKISPPSLWQVQDRFLHCSGGGRDLRNQFGAVK